MIHVKTQKIYTFPDRKLYGEYCLLSLLELRVKIVKGEIKEQLCIIGENDEALIFDEYARPDRYVDDYIEQQYDTLLSEIIELQMNIRKNKINNQNK